MAVRSGHLGCSSRPSNADRAMWRKPVKKRRPRVGLALSGGAARGIAHVGVLKVLVANDVPIDCIAGTSAGAIVAGAFAAGMPLDEIEEIGRRLRWRDVGRVAFSRLGIQSNERLEQMIRQRFPVTRFEQLRIPFAAVATDLQTGAPVVLRDEGDIAFAIRASCTLPGWYVPVVDSQGRRLVDGGLVANVPVAATRDLGAEVVIAVDVNAEGAKFMGAPQSAIGVLVQAMLCVQRIATAHQLAQADVVIKPAVGHIRWDEMARADELIEAGAQATQQSLDEIQRLIAPPAEESRSGLWRWFRSREAETAGD